MTSTANSVRHTQNCDNMKHVLIASLGVCAPFLFVGVVALCEVVGVKLGSIRLDGRLDALRRPPRKRKPFIDNIPRN